MSETAPPKRRRRMPLFTISLGAVGILAAIVLSAPVVEAHPQRGLSPQAKAGMAFAAFAVCVVLGLILDDRRDN